MSYLYLVLFKIGNNIFFQFSLLGLIWLSRHEIQNPSHPLAYYATLNPCSDTNLQPPIWKA